LAASIVMFVKLSAFFHGRLVGEQVLGRQHATMMISRFLFLNGILVCVYISEDNNDTLRDKQALQQTRS